MRSSWPLAPNAVTAALGETAVWTFAAPPYRYLTDESGLGLFAASDQFPGSSYTYRFVAAGTYAYADSSEAAVASVAVPVTATPASGHASTKFTVTWVAGAMPSGYFSNVQIERPGDTDFHPWKTGVASISAKFAPDGGKGTYRFRAQFGHGSATSGFSPVATITVS